MKFGSLYQKEICVIQKYITLAKRIPSSDSMNVDTHNLSNQKCHDDIIECKIYIHDILFAKKSFSRWSIPIIRRSLV